MPAQAPFARAGLRVHDDGARTRGLALQGVSDGAVGGLALETAYTQRDGTPAGPWRAADVTGVWTAALAADALERRLSLHAEYALSHHSVRSIDEQREAVTGEARELRVAWRQRPAADATTPRWTVAMEQAMAESAFHGFAARPRAGVRVRQVVGELDWGRLQARLARELQAKRLDGSEASRRLLDASLRYQGDSLSRLPFGEWLFAAPRFGVAFQRTAAAGSGAVPTMATIEAVFGRDGWQWGLRHQREYPGVSGWGLASARVERTRLQLALPLNASLTLRPAIEQVSLRQTAGALPARHWSGRLAAELMLVPRRLQGRLRLHAREPGDAKRSRVVGLAGGLDWTLPALPGRRPRIALKLDGGLELRDPPTQSAALQHYQASAAVEVSWGH